jgi:leader peptidase (prepilin peptidase) / N-methyltransferase
MGPWEPVETGLDSSARMTAGEAAASLAAGIGALALLVWLGLATSLAVTGAGLAAALLAIALIDRRSFLIPDWLSLPLIPLGLVAAGSAIDPRAHAFVPVHHVLGAAAGAGLLYLVALGYRRWRGRDGMGLGDVKLAAAAGAWVGLEPLAHVLLLACAGAFASLAVMALNGRAVAIVPTMALPFGTFLAPAIWLVWLWQQMLA